MATYTSVSPSHVASDLAGLHISASVLNEIDNAISRFSRINIETDGSPIAHNGLPNLYVTPDSPVDLNLSGRTPEIVVAQGPATVVGSDAPQTLIGGDAPVTFSAGSAGGNHVLDAGSAGLAAGLADGQAAGSVLYGGSGADTLNGSTDLDGAALLVGGSGHNVLNGGIGFDTLIGGGHSVLNAGDGAPQELIGGLS